MSLKKKREVVAEGISESLAKIDGLKKRAGVDKVYLAYDYGLFDSRTFEQQMYYNSSDLLVKFQEDMYDGGVSYSEYKKSLMSVKFQNPGYVAMVQMTLSSRGKCLLVAGDLASILSNLCLRYSLRRSTLFRVCTPQCMYIGTNNDNY